METSRIRTPRLVSIQQRSSSVPRIPSCMRHNWNTSSSILHKRDNSNLRHKPSNNHNMRNYKQQIQPENTNLQYKTLASRRTARDSQAPMAKTAISTGILKGRDPWALHWDAEYAWEVWDEVSIVGSNAQTRVTESNCRVRARECAQYSFSSPQLFMDSTRWDDGDARQTDYRRTTVISRNTIPSRSKSSHPTIQSSNSCRHTSPCWPKEP